MVKKYKVSFKKKRKHNNLSSKNIKNPRIKNIYLENKIND